MDPTNSHERCSELLVPLVRGELTPTDIAAVERHLEGCPDCARELAAVRSLLGAPVGAMDDLERARLRSEIAAGLHHVSPAGPEDHSDDDGAPRSVRPASPRRVQPGAWLGVAAATVILFVGALAYLASGGFVTRGSDQGGGVGSSHSAESAGGAGARAQAGRDEGLDARLQSARSPVVVQKRTEFTEESLNRLGRTAPIFRAFARVYGSDGVRRLRGRFARVIERRLGGARVGACLDQTVTARPGSLPAYGAIGTLEGQRVLVLGFFIPGSQGAKVGHFEVKWWVLEGPGRGTGCPQPLGSDRGPAAGPGESR